MLVNVELSIPKYVISTADFKKCTSIVPPIGIPIANSEHKIDSRENNFVRGNPKAIASPGETAKSATRTRTRLSQLGMSSGTRLSAKVSKPETIRVRLAAAVDQFFGFSTGISFIKQLVHALYLLSSSAAYHLQTRRKHQQKNTISPGAPHHKHRKHTLL